MVDSDFVEMVQQMRDAQKEYIKLVTSKDVPFKRKEISQALRRSMFLESQVDIMLVALKDSTRQLLLLDLMKRTDETPGAYNVEHDTEKSEGSAA